jgi:hypothetical protein
VAHVGSPRDLAHGVGGISDLPVPAHDAYVAAALALLVSFAVLALAWREPRFRGDESGRPLPPFLVRVIESQLTRAALVTASLAFSAWIAMAAFFGTSTVVNPTFGVVYVWLWVGLVPASILFGPIYRLCNPLRWIHRGVCAVAGLDHSTGIAPYPRRLGLWPAAVGLFAFTWLELVSPTLSVSIDAIRIWFGLVAVLLVMGAFVFGDVFFARADPFEVYSSLVARLSPFGRRRDGALVVRNPLENLDTTPPTPGLVGVVSVLFGSTAFDSFKESTRWLSFSQDYSQHNVLLNSAALLTFCLIVLGTFTLACVVMSLLGHLHLPNLPNLMAHSVVPIVIGYIVAHYLSFFVSQGVATLVYVGDPLTKGWDLTAWAADINKYAIYEHPTALAVTKVAAVVVGHVLGVIAAHDRSVRLLPKRHQVSGQLPMLVLMVAYTLTGLWLLFSS